MSDCERCRELTARLFDAADRFRNAAEQTWTDGQDSNTDELWAALVDAGNDAYEAARKSALEMPKSCAHTPAERGQGE